MTNHEQLRNPSEDSKKSLEEKLKKSLVITQKRRKAIPT